MSDGERSRDPQERPGSVCAGLPAPGVGRGEANVRVGYLDRSFIHSFMHARSRAGKGRRRRAKVASSCRQLQAVAGSCKQLQAVARDPSTERPLTGGVWSFCQEVDQEGRFLRPWESLGVPG